MKDGEVKKEGMLARFQALNTSVICDVFDEFGWEAPALDTAIRGRTGRGENLVGWAYTIEGRLDSSKGPDRFKLEVVDNVPADSVTVWSGTNAKGICLFGDLIAATMAKRGCRGAVVDGGFRDTEVIEELNFPVYARYTSPVQAVGRWRVHSRAESVELPSALGGRVRVSTGDLVFGDGDGVIVVPSDRVDKVLQRAEAVVADEAEARELGSDGLSAIEMLERFGHV